MQHVMLLMNRSGPFFLFCRETANVKRSHVICRPNFMQKTKKMKRPRFEIYVF